MEMAIAFFISLFEKAEVNNVLKSIKNHEK